MKRTTGRTHLSILLFILLRIFFFKFLFKKKDKIWGFFKLLVKSHNHQQNFYKNPYLLQIHYDQSVKHQYLVPLL